MATINDFKIVNQYSKKNTFETRKKTRRRCKHQVKLSNGAKKKIKRLKS